MRHNGILTLKKSGAPFLRIDIIYMIYPDVKYFSLVCLSIYLRNLLYTYKLGHFFAEKLNFLSLRRNLKFNCVKMSVFETHFRIFNLCFSYIQHVVTSYKFTSFRLWKIETLALLTIKENCIRIYYEQELLVL